MKFRHYLALFILGIIVNFIIASLEQWPGYMDADYYFSGGRRLVSGYGFSEIILWNYLDDPEGIPHPSHGYWMPLASILAAGGMAIVGDMSFTAGRLGSIIVAGFLAPITAALAYSFTFRRRDAFLAGILSTISGFYAPFLVTTDSFGIIALLGGLIFLILGGFSKSTMEYKTKRILIFFVLGVLTGLMYLTRTDGVLWLVVLAGWVLSSALNCLRSRRRILAGDKDDYLPKVWWYLLDLCILGSGYIFVIGPWLVRNIRVFGTPFTPGGWQILWITEYDELFMYPASVLTPERWISTGLGENIRSILWAVGQNLQTTVVVQGLIFLFPLVILGLWHFRRDLRVRIVAIVWLLIFTLMTFVLPHVGARGGFFHAGSALQPLFWSMVPVGLADFIHWGEIRRDWQPAKARVGFGVILILLAFGFTIGILWLRVIGNNLGDFTWGAGERAYVSLEEKLSDHGISTQEVVIVNNPPGYHIATGRAAIAIPNGDEQTLFDVAERYGATFVILEANHPQALSHLYENPVDVAGLRYLKTFEGTHIFRIE